MTIIDQSKSALLIGPTTRGRSGVRDDANERYVPEPAKANHVYHVEPSPDGAHLDVFLLGEWKGTVAPQHLLTFIGELGA